MIKAIIFDFDGTLFDSFEPNFLAWRKAFATGGKKISVSEFKREFAGLTMKATVGKAFPKKSEEELKGIETGYVRDLLERLEKEAKPVSGAKEFLRECKKRKLRVAIASSAFGGYVNEMVEKIGLKEFFKVVVCAGDAKRGKPFPDLFLLAAEKLGVEPSKCLVVEDAVYGVIAAKRAGMKCAGITTTTSQKELKKAGADLVFSNYGKLPKLIFG